MSACDTTPVQTNSDQLDDDILFKENLILLHLCSLLQQPAAVLSQNSTCPVNSPMAVEFKSPELLADSRDSVAISSEPTDKTCASVPREFDWVPTIWLLIGVGVGILLQYTPHPMICYGAVVILCLTFCAHNKIKYKLD